MPRVIELKAIFHVTGPSGNWTQMFDAEQIRVMVDLGLIKWDKTVDGDFGSLFTHYYIHA